MHKQIKKCDSILLSLLIRGNVKREKMEICRKVTHFFLSLFKKIFNVDFCYYFNIWANKYNI